MWGYRYRLKLDGWTRLEMKKYVIPEPLKMGNLGFLDTY